MAEVEIPVHVVKNLADLFELEQRLGDGSYAVVHLATRKRATATRPSAAGLLADAARPNRVALKRYKDTHIRDVGLPEPLVREAALLQRLRHRNIVQMDCIVVAKPRIFLALEYCPHSLETVLDVRDSNNPDDYLVDPVLRESEVAHVMRGLLNALTYCHAKGVIHRDISPSNIFLLLDTPFALEQATVKLGDFNLSRMSDNVEDATLTPGMTTISYRAPEVLMQYDRDELATYGTAVDLWSVGCICAEAVRGAPIFDHDTQLGMLAELITALGEPPEHMIASWPERRRKSLVKGVRKAAAEHSNRGFRERLPQNISKSAVAFIEALLTYDPRNRLSAPQALKHSFLL